MSDEGYEFVPIPPDVRRTVHDAARHDRMVPGTLAATLTLRLIAEQPVHIGSGFKALRDNHIVRASMTSSGVPCVPGSTLKGLLRGRFEAITRSCALFRANDRPTKIRSSSFPGARARLSRDVASISAFQPCREGPVCPACALFGRMSLRSRIAASDFTTSPDVQFDVDTVAAMFGPNLHHVGRFTPGSDRGDTMLTVTSLHGRKFARGRGPETADRERIEVIPRGSAISGVLRVHNVTRAEFGGLLAALGVEPASLLKVGGGKGHGFGRLRVDSLSIAKHGRSDDVGSDFQRYAQEFLASPDAWKEGLAALVHIHAKERAP